MPNPACHQAGIVPDSELDDPPPSEVARWRSIILVLAVDIRMNPLY